MGAKPIRTISIESGFCVSKESPPYFKEKFKHSFALDTTERKYFFVVYDDNTETSWYEFMSHAIDAVTIEANGVSKELLLPVDDSINDQWQSIRLDLSKFSLETSNVSSIAIMGVGGTPGVSTFYVTDYKFVKTQEPEVDDTLESPFIILHSSLRISGMKTPSVPKMAPSFLTSPPSGTSTRRSFLS